MRIAYYAGEGDPVHIDDFTGATVEDIVAELRRAYAAASAPGHHGNLVSGRGKRLYPATAPRGSCGRAGHINPEEDNMTKGGPPMAHRIITNQELRVILGMTQAEAERVWQRLHAGETVVHKGRCYRYVGYGVIHVDPVESKETERMTLRLDDATRAAVRAWMGEHQHLYFAYAFLAEACAEALDLADDDPHNPTPEEVYEIALEFFPDC